MFPALAVKNSSKLSCSSSFPTLLTLLYVLVGLESWMGTMKGHILEECALEGCVCFPTGGDLVMRMGKS